MNKMIQKYKRILLLIDWAVTACVFSLSCPFYLQLMNLFVGLHIHRMAYSQGNDLLMTLLSTDFTLNINEEYLAMHDVEKCKRNVYERIINLTVSLKIYVSLQ